MIMNRTLIACLLATLVVSFDSALSAPLGTIFTYQGRLNDGTNPANGNYELRLTLFDSQNSGALIAGPKTNLNI